MQDNCQKSDLRQYKGRKKKLRIDSPVTTNIFLLFAKYKNFWINAILSCQKNKYTGEKKETNKTYLLCLIIMTRYY